VGRVGAVVGLGGEVMVREVSCGAPAVTPGQPMTVSYTLENVGANAAQGQLFNAVYLSADTTFDSSQDPLVGLDVASIDLAPGTAARLKQQVAFAPLPQASQPGGVTSITPPLTPGPYHGIVRANVRSSIRESDAGNNAGASSGTVTGEVPALTIDVAEPFSLSADQTRFYKVNVPLGQDLTFTMTSDVGGATNDMFVAYGRTPSGSDFDFSGPAGFPAPPAVLVPETQAGESFVLVTARSPGTLASVEHLTLTARLLPFSITSHAPAAGGAGGHVTGRVRGAGLRATTVVRLEQSGV